MHTTDDGSTKNMAVQEQILRDRIVVSREITHGQPRVAGTRIMVHLVIDLLAAGKSIAEIISDDYYPDLTQEDVLACMAYSNDKY
jgi:uncharacterized protein (DUF433 family)